MCLSFGSGWFERGGTAGMANTQSAHVNAGADCELERLTKAEGQARYLTQTLNNP